MWDFIRRFMGYPVTAATLPEPIAPYKIEGTCCGSCTAPPIVERISEPDAVIVKAKAPRKTKPVAVHTSAPMITAKAPRKPREPKQ